MKKKPKEETKLEKQKRQKREKPYRSCTWYPMQCEGFCDDGQGACSEYITDSEHEALVYG